MTGARRLVTLSAVARVLRDSRKPGSPGLGERVAALPRLLRAAFGRRYDGLSWARLALMAAGVAYIVSPIDLVPEALFWVFGVADDAAVAAWVAAAVLVETDRFLVWERTDPAARAQAPDEVQVVPGEVVAG
ncbi:MAG TPA: YkvA family protein [Jiangellales bacterium]|nr:YkvA family protein [Jiangellales bacterium]